MSEAEKKQILSDIDKKIDGMPRETLVWLDGFVTGSIKAAAEKCSEEQKEGA